MNLDDVNKLGEFFNAVARVIRKKYINFHWPDSECFRRTCRGYGLSRPDQFAGRECNWNEIHTLVVRFFESAPDIDDEWKRIARHAKVDPDDFHELLIGVFIGGVKKPYLSPADAFYTQRSAMNAALIEASKNRKTP